MVYQKSTAAGAGLTLLGFQPPAVQLPRDLPVLQLVQLSAGSCNMQKQIRDAPGNRVQHGWDLLAHLLLSSRSTITTTKPGPWQHFSSTDGNGTKQLF